MNMNNNKKLEDKYKMMLWSLIGLIVVFIFILIRG